MSENARADISAGESRFLVVSRVAILLTSLTPLVLFPGFLFPFVTLRNVFFRICVETALAAILLAGMRRLKYANARGDPILRWFFGYLIAIALAALFGLSPWHSLFGDFERMGGVWALLHLLLFYLVLRVVMRAGDWTILFRSLILVADLVVVWGASEFLPAAFRNPLFQTTLSSGSTVGNPGLLAPYLLLSLGVAIWVLTHEGGRQWRIFAAFSAAMLLFGIASARNRSSELGLIVAVAFGAALFFGLHRDRISLIRNHFLAVIAWLAVGVGGAYLFNRGTPAMAHHFGERWNGFLHSPVDHIRTLEWKIAFDGFRDRPLLGYGPENHQIVASHHFDPRIYEIWAEGGIFDRTHNAWLELLATSGIIGTLAMLGIWWAAGFTIQEGLRLQKLTAAEAAIFSGAFLGYAFYLTFWFFDIHASMVWVTLLAFLGSRVYGRPEIFVSAHEGRASAALPPALKWGTVVVLALAAFLHGFIPLVAAHDLAIASEAGLFQPRLNAFERVMNSAAPQTLHTFPLYYQFLRSSSGHSDVGNPFFVQEYDLALKRGMIESDRNIARSPEDDRSYVDAARFWLLAGAFYRDQRPIAKARDQLLSAIKISPKRPDSRLLLAAVYLSLDDSSKSMAQLDSSMRIAPAYAPAFAFAAQQVLARSNVDSAASLLAISSGLGFKGNQPVYAKVIAALDDRGESARAARLSQGLLENVYGPFPRWSRGRTPTGVALTPLADSLASRLPILYVKAGLPGLALRAARAIAAVRPESQAALDAFNSDLAAGRLELWKGRADLFSPVRPRLDIGAPENPGAVNRAHHRR